MDDPTDITAAITLLRANGYTVSPPAATPRAKRAEDATELFEQMWALYPKRAGSSKAATLKAWNARIKAGCWAVDMLEGAKRYAAYVTAKRKEPEFIKMAQTFFGPGLHFKSDWGTSGAASSRHEGGGKFNFAEADRSADRSAQERSMARHGVTIPDGEVSL